MEEISVKEFAEKRKLTETQVRRILEHPERYPWNRYGISRAYKPCRSWIIQPKDMSVVVVAPGATEQVDRAALLAGSFERAYPIGELLRDLQTRPLGEVMNNMIQRLPPPTEVGRHVAQIAKGGPKPDEMLSRIKSFFH